MLPDVLRKAISKSDLNLARSVQSLLERGSFLASLGSVLPSLSPNSATPAKTPDI